MLANSGWLLFDRIFRMALSLLVGAWVARHLGPVQYGELAYWIAAFSVLQVVCSLGLESLVVRDLAREPSNQRSILGTALLLRLAVGAACWAGAVAACALLRPDDRSGLVMITLLGAALLVQPADVVDQWLQSRTRNRDSIPLKCLAYGMTAALKVILILSGAPLWTFAAAVSAEFLLTALALVATASRAPAWPRLAWQGAVAIRLLRDSWPLLVAGLSVMVYMRIDMMMLRTLADERQLGLYSAVLPLSQAWHVVPMTVCASVLARAAQLKTTQPMAYEQRLRQLFALMLWGGLWVAGITAVLAPWLVGWLLGSAYSDAVVVLRWHALTNVFVFLGVAQSVAIVSDGHSMTALVRTLMGAAASVVLNLWLVPRHGAVGAAWAAIGSQACAAVLSNAVLAPHYLRMQCQALLLRGLRSHTPPPP